MVLLVHNSVLPQCRKIRILMAEKKMLFVLKEENPWMLSKDIMKINHVKEYFNKHIKTVVLITNIKKIKTKKNEDMAFLTGQDETGIIDFTLFPKQIKLINNIKNQDLVLINGIVEKRLDKYQINILNIEKVGV